MGVWRAGGMINGFAALVIHTRILVADVDGLHPQRRGRVGDLLAVLVGTGLEEHLLAGHALVPSQHVRRDRLVRVSDVRVPCGHVSYNRWKRI